MVTLLKDFSAIPEVTKWCRLETAFWVTETVREKSAGLKLCCTRKLKKI